MNKNKIYIAGKITGDEHYKAKFNRAEEMINYHMELCGRQHCQFCPFYSRDYIFGCMIRGRKLHVVNPVSFPIEGRSWIVCMVYCIIKLLRCEYVYMLKDWGDSKGARLEHKVATMFNKTIIYE